MALLMLFISSVFVNNILLTRFLGNCPFLGVSSKLETAKGMGIAVVLVIFKDRLVDRIEQRVGREKDKPQTPGGEDGEQPSEPEEKS